MKEYKGAVFFDFDGTLVDEREKLYIPTDATKNSIERLKQNGYMVGLATGRAKCYVPETGIGFDCYVTSNGAYAAVNDKIIADEVFGADELKTLFKFFAENNMGYMTENQEQCFYSTANYDQFEEMINKFNISMVCFSPMPADGNIKANKMMFTYDDDDTLERLRGEFSDKYYMTKHRHDPSGDLGIKGVTKAGGIQKVIDVFGLDIADTYAFGDGENDLEMLSSVGHGIAMGLHSEKLDGIAEYVTDTVINEGVTAGLKKFRLI